MGQRVNISLIHPFSPNSAGVKEKSVAYYHSQPHVEALKAFFYENESNIFIDYFTENWFSYSFEYNSIYYRFFPVNRDIRGDYRKWKKQRSTICLNRYKKECPDISIINMSGHSSPFSHKLAKVIKKSGKQYIAMLGGLHYTDSPENREYYKEANHLLVHTDLQRKEMQKISMFQDLDIRVFPLGVDCIQFSPKEPSIEMNKKPKLLFVGRVIELKRIQRIIETLKLLHEYGFNNAILEIIGPAPSADYLKRLKKLVYDKNLTKFVFFRGLVKHRNLNRYFQNSDLLCLPSTNESFGMVMIEAMSCGTPVAAVCNSGGPDEVIIDGFNGILCTYEEYPNRILEFFVNYENKKRIAYNSRITVLENFSIEITKKVLGQSIISCLNKE